MEIPHLGFNPGNENTELVGSLFEALIPNS
jgi:hypothetical protein